MIAFVCAMEKEALTVLNNLDVSAVYTVMGKSLTLGTILEHKCAVAVSGIGKVNAAMTTQHLLDEYKDIDTVVNIGVCGGVRGKVEPGGIYVVDKCSQFDFDTTAIDDVKIGQLYEFDQPFINVFNNKAKALSKVYPVASLVTGDKFDCTQQTVDMIERNFGAQLREMEGGAIAQVCAINRVDCVLVKGVSDFVGPNSSNMYLQTCKSVLETFEKQMTAIVSAIVKY